MKKESNLIFQRAVYSSQLEDATEFLLPKKLQR
jgi:hypothetical protein